jgi:tetratricopeptide (TPR) repeat protein
MYFLGKNNLVCRLLRFLFMFILATEINLFCEENIELLYREGVELYNNKKYGEAIEKFYEIISVEPQMCDACFYIGLSFFKLSDYESAMEWFEYLLEINPEYTQVYYFLGITYLKLKKYDAAIQALLVAKEYEPQKYSIYYNLGIAYYKTNNLEEAIDNFISAIKLNSNLPEAYYILGVLYYKLGYYEEAREAFGSLIAIDKEKKFAGKIDKYLSKLQSEEEKEEKKRLFLTGNLSGCYDSNVNYIPNSEYSTSGMEDTSYIGTFSGRYNIFDNFSLSASIQQLFYNKNSSYNYGNVSAGLLIDLISYREFHIGVEGKYLISKLGGSFFNNTKKVISDLQFSPAKNTSFLFVYTYSLSSYSTEYMFLDGYTHDVSLSNCFYLGSSYMKLELSYKYEKHKDQKGEGVAFSYYDYTLSTPTYVTQYLGYYYCYSSVNSGISFDFFTPLSKTVSLLCSVSYEMREYLKKDVWFKPIEGVWAKEGDRWYKRENSSWVESDEPKAPVFSKKRLDTEFTISLLLFKSLSQNLTLYMNYISITNSSNLTRNDYVDRNYSKQMFSITLSLKI